MKSVEELALMRERLKDESESNGKEIKVLVGLATCGIAAGARPVMDAFKDEVEKRGLDNVEIKQTGCIGICQFEPVVEVYTPDGERVTYVHMTADKVPQIVSEHLQSGSPVVDYTIGKVNS